MSRPHAARRPLPYLVLGVLAWLAYGWSLGLGFQYDDHWLLPASGEQLRLLLGAFSNPEPPPPPFDHLFQPVLWLWAQLDIALSGEPYRPWVFHASSVTVHMGTAMLLLAVLCRHFGAVPAFVGAAFFAITPAGAQAVTWTAARGDMLWVTLTLAGMLALPKRAWLAGFCLALAFASKSSGWLSLPVLAVYGWRRSGLSVAKCLSMFLWLLAPLACVAVWRAAYLETWSMVYIGQVRAGPEQLGDVLDAVPAALGYALTPFDIDSSDLLAAGMRILGIPAWTMLFLLFGGCMLEGPTARYRQLLANLPFVLVPLLPAAFLWHFFADPLGISQSRSLYPVVPGIAGLLALLLYWSGRRKEPGRTTWVLAWIGCIWLGLLLVVALVRVASLELAAGHATGSRLTSLRELAARAPDDTTFVVEDPVAELAGVLMTGTQLPTAMRMPFAADPVAVIHCPSLEEFAKAGGLATIPGPVQLLYLEGARFVPVSPVLPPMRADLPKLLRDESTPPRWTPEFPVAPREFSYLEIQSEELQGQSTAVLWLRCGGKSHMFPLRVDDGLAIFDMRPHLELQASPSLRSIRVAIRASGTYRHVEISPMLVRDLAPLTIQHPEAGATLPLQATPRFSIGDFPVGADLELTCTVRLFGAELVFRYLVPSAELDRTVDVVRYSPQLEHFFGEGGQEWPQAMQTLYQDFAQKYGIAEIGLLVRAAALRQSVRVAQSADRPLMLKPK